VPRARVPLRRRQRLELAGDRAHRAGARGAGDLPGRPPVRVERHAGAAGAQPQRAQGAAVDLPAAEAGSLEVDRMARDDRVELRARQHAGDVELRDVPAAAELEQPPAGRRARRAVGDVQQRVVAAVQGVEPRGAREAPGRRAGEVRVDQAGQDAPPAEVDHPRAVAGQVLHLASSPAATISPSRIASACTVVPWPSIVVIRPL
jgi:hypothetical protein